MHEPVIYKYYSICSNEYTDFKVTLGICILLVCHNGTVATLTVFPGLTRKAMFILYNLYVFSGCSVFAEANCCDVRTAQFSLHVTPTEPKPCNIQRSGIS